MCIYCIARGVVIFCVVNMTLTCEWMNEWSQHALFLSWNGRNRYLHLSLLKIWDFFHSWEIQRLSTRFATLHSCKDGISHTRGRNPRSSIGVLFGRQPIEDMVMWKCFLWSKYPIKCMDFLYVAVVTIINVVHDLMSQWKSSHRMAKKELLNWH